MKIFLYINTVMQTVRTKENFQTQCQHDTVFEIVSCETFNFKSISNIYVTVDLFS